MRVYERGKQMYYTVYEHINKINGKKYIGVTRQKPSRRWGHEGIGYKGNTIFWRAIQKYGWNGFEHKVVACNLTEQEAYDLERLLIFTNQSNHRKYGYNLAPGGEHNEMSSEGRLRLSQKNKGENNPNYGNHKLAGENNPNYGKTHSLEIRQRISDAKRGKKMKPFTAEHKAKIREHHKGGTESKKVVCVETGIVYQSINDAARAININKKVISSCCRNVPHYNTAGGYHWRFA